MQLGDVQLEVGYLVTAIVRGPGSVPVVDADFDCIRTKYGYGYHWICR